MKNPLSEFSIPILGLKQSHYEFDFQLDQSFFSNFEESLVQNGNINLKVELERKTSHLEFSFDFEGTVKADCDRCTAQIQLPIEGQEQLIVKYSEEPQDDEDEIIYIHPETPELNIAQFVYEYINLAVPLKKAYDCENDENPPCDFKTLAYLEKNIGEASVENEPENGSAWDALKDWNQN
jgi:uncharacterized protein